MDAIILETLRKANALPVTAEHVPLKVLSIPVTAINFKSGSYARLQFHGENECFSVEGMAHDFQKKGVFSGYNLHGFLEKGVFFKRQLPWIIGWLKAK